MNLTCGEIDEKISNHCEERNSLNVTRMDGFCILNPYLGI